MKFSTGFCNDGKLEIVVIYFIQYVEVLEGWDGDKITGIFPLVTYIFGIIQFLFITLMKILVAF